MTQFTGGCDDSSCPIEALQMIDNGHPMDDVMELYGTGGDSGGDVCLKAI